MLPQRSFFNPVRHKRITCTVAIATTLICAAIMGQTHGYGELAKAVANYATEFIQLLRSQFSSSTT